MNTAFDDADYPAYTMGRAAEMIGVTPAFLRSLGTAGLIEPQRSLGGHRRYSRHQLQLAGRVRQLLDEGMPLTAACRIVTLEDRLAAAHRHILDLGGTLTPDDDANVPTQTHPDIATPSYYRTPAP
ncbi:MerR family transcriptional regulator [Jidongwangia harbinensis]|uniref:MerR family transcriptional regulator n=1 Tax=Jidongwangia harbinensis TaxID=2878561 RepID=UPI001CD94B8F|nr:MerR family transcriptional regulator [Jidongwangia harbinensis]MCA2215203.1 MerR family transcriptional regulator [Jidongwangia harbinensis]